MTGIHVVYQYLPGNIQGFRAFGVSLQPVVVRHIISVFPNRSSGRRAFHSPCEVSYVSGVLGPFSWDDWGPDHT